MSEAHAILFILTSLIVIITPGQDIILVMSSKPIIDVRRDAEQSKLLNHLLPTRRQHPSHPALLESWWTVISYQAQVQPPLQHIALTASLPKHLRRAMTYRVVD